MPKARPKSWCLGCMGSVVVPFKDTHGFLSQLKERKSAICRTEGKGTREVTSFALRAGSDLRVLRDRGCLQCLGHDYFFLRVSY